MANSAVKWLKNSAIGNIVGSFVGTDSIIIKNGKYYHENGKPLTAKEREAFLEYRRRKAHREFQNRSDTGMLRADRAQGIMDDPNVHPGRTVDKAAFSGPTSGPKKENKKFGLPIPEFVPPKFGHR